MTGVVAGLADRNAADWSDGSSASDLRLLGIVLACAIPAMFWTCAFALIAYECGMVIKNHHLMGCALAVAAWCSMVAAVLMGRPRVS